MQLEVEIKAIWLAKEASLKVAGIKYTINSNHNVDDDSDNNNNNRTNKKDKQPNSPTLHAHPLFKYKLVWIFSLKARRRSYIIDSNANLRTFHN